MRGINISKEDAIKMAHQIFEKFEIPEPGRILPDPDPGFEWVQSPILGKKDSHKTVTFEQLPIRKLYDWSKVGPNVLVSASGGRLSIMAHSCDPEELVLGVWQAHIGGDPCPVHAEATMIEVRGNNGRTIERAASDVDWSLPLDRIYRVTGLMDGYSYK